MNKYKWKMINIFKRKKNLSNKICLEIKIYKLRISKKKKISRNRLTMNNVVILFRLN